MHTRILPAVATLAVGVLVLGLTSSTAAAQTETRSEQSARAESLTYDPDGTERYLALGATTTAQGTTVALDSYAAGWTTCSDGSAAWRFEATSGSAPGVLTITGSLAGAAVDAVLELRTELLSGCPGSGGPPVVRTAPVGLRLTAIAPTIRTRNSVSVHVPSEQNQRDAAHAVSRAAAGTIRVGGRAVPSTSASIERWRIWSRGGTGAAAPAVFGLAPLSWLLGPVEVDNTRRTVLQANGAWTRTDEDWPAPGSSRRYLGVIAETVDRGTTTVYVAFEEETVITCGAGLAVRTTARFGSAAGTLEVGPRYSTATAEATVPVIERRTDGCTGQEVVGSLGPARAGLDLRSDSPVVTVRDLDAFTGGPDLRRRDSTRTVGRPEASGTIFFGGLVRTPTQAAIGEQRTSSHTGSAGR